MLIKVSILNLIIIHFVCITYGFPNGAPESACSSLKPEHSSNKPQSTKSPFTVTFNKSSYKNNEQVKITIKSSGSKKIKGFLIAAKQSPGNAIIGTFVSGASVNLLTCSKSNDAATHNSPNDKSQINITWKPPTGFKGDVIFRYTIVEKYDKYWHDQKSKKITIV